MQRDSLHTPPVPASAPEIPGKQQAILFLDMVGYSRCMESDEAATLDFMSNCFDTLRILTRRYDCMLVKTLGDGALLVFDRSDDAIDYAIEFQKITNKVQRGATEPFLFRVGIHRGLVTFRNGDVYGNAVNIAARVQGTATPGGCIVSQAVYEEVGNTTEIDFQSIGFPLLKNIAERIQLYQIIGPHTDMPLISPTALPCLHLIGAPIMELPAGQRKIIRGPYTVGIMSYLAACPGHMELTDRLIELFWPDLRHSSGRRALGQTLSSLKRQLETASEILQIEEEWVGLDGTGFETDLEQIEADLRRSSVAPELLIDGRWPERIFAAAKPNAPGFAVWTRVTRDAWRRRIGIGLERILESEPADTESFGQASDALLLLEPGNEIASCARISHSVDRGNRTAALEEYERLKDYLSRTYGVAPGSRIRSVIQAALRGASAKGETREAREGRVRRRRLLRIVVRPFASRGKDSDRVSAFRSELVSNLARFRDWSVLDDLPSETTPHTADYDITGSTTDVQNDVPLDISLRKLPEQRVLCSDRISLKFDAWGEAQHRVLRRITAEFESYISTDRLMAAMDRLGHESTSHDAWLRGDKAMMRWSPEGMKEARQIFTTALGKDPDHVPSLTSLASMTNIQHLVWPGLKRDPEQTREADAMARRAVEIDPMDSRVHRVVAWTASFNGAFERASLHADRAFDLNPNSPVTLASCALAYAWFGEREKSDATITRLLEITGDLAPWLWSYLSVAYYFLDRLDDALRAAELSDDQIVDTQGWIAAIEARRGNMAAAAEAFAGMIERVKPVWRGESSVTPRAVADWFTTAFPIRHSADREKLSQPFAAVLQRL